jgi:hypothetical protein
MTSLSRSLFAACLLAAGVGPAAAAAAGTAPKVDPARLERVITLPVDGSVLLTAQGQVAEFRCDTPLSRELREKLDRNVLQWRFRMAPDTPPGGGRAKLRVVLAGFKVGDSYTIQIDNVLFPGEPEKAAAGQKAPPISPKLMQPPRYPETLQRAGVSGTVLLAILVSADGRSEKILPVQSMLFDVRGRDRALAAGIHLLEQTAVAIARRWTYNIAPQRGALPAGERTVMVPVAFDMSNGGTPAPGTWRTVVRVPKRPIDWLPDSPEAQHVGVSDVVAGEMVPATSVVKLTSDVIGKALL